MKKRYEVPDLQTRRMEAEETLTTSYGDVEIPAGDGSLEF